jgi:NAD(P)-dependent dehydrogenase (short-subunit alcohol dehydrogenase family)
MSPIPSPTPTQHSATYSAISPSRPELSLAGKTILLTGGGAGIGLAIAKSIAQAGAKTLIILGRRKEVLFAAAKTIHDFAGDQTRIFPISADISDKTQVDAAFSKIAAELPDTKLDVLINNAGYFTGPRAFGTETVEEWQKMFDINVKGVYLITSAFLKLAAAKDAKIINISSAIAHLPPHPFPGFSSYAATKMAGSKIMQYAAADYPDISVLDLHPGQVTETDMASKVEGLEHIDDGKSSFPIYYLIYRILTMSDH